MSGESVEERTEKEASIISEEEARATLGDLRRFPVLIGLKGPLHDQAFTIDKNLVNLGRDMLADIVVKDSRASRYHSRIIYKNAESHGEFPVCRVLDLGSANGTFVNGRRVPVEGTPLRDKDRVQVGRAVFGFFVRNEQEMSLDVKIAEMAIHDNLTGLNNRVTFDRVLSREFDRARRYKSELALLIIDLDALRKINAEHGIAGGDVVLKQVGALLHERLRTCDFAARYGGEEFYLLLPETDAEGAMVLADRLARAIAFEPFKIGVGTASITASIGVATLAWETDAADDMISMASQALGRAKEKGGNQAALHERPGDEGARSPNVES